MAAAGANRGRRIAAGLGAIALAALAGTAYVARDRIAEEWWLRRLGSSDDGVRIAAAERLADHRVVRAAPRLVEIIARDDREKTGGGGISTISRKGFQTASSWTLLTPIAYSLWRLVRDAPWAIGSTIQPAISGLDSEREWRARNVLETIVVLQGAAPEKVKKMKYGRLGALPPP